MARRTYRLGRRAHSAEETRRRLVEATYALHNERGIRATSMIDIAQRAGVSAGTVYHHFPSYEDAILACARHTADHKPLPGPDILHGLSSLPDRVQRLTAAIFSYFERFPSFERIRAERKGMPPVEAFFDVEERNRLALTREALAPFTTDASLINASAAVLDAAVHSALRRAGFSTARAAETIAEFVLARCAEQTSATVSKRR